jgi:hypothetical protein
MLTIPFCGNEDVEELDRLIFCEKPYTFDPYAVVSIAQKIIAMARPRIIFFTVPPCYFV